MTRSARILATALVGRYIRRDGTRRQASANQPRIAPMDIEQPPNFRPATDNFRWEAVPHQPYKQDGSAPFKDVSRQTLFHEDALNCELRYFEVGAGGFSTLERHEHVHAVMILRGRGDCLVGDEVRQIKQFDLISIPALEWHQFRATANEPLGFLCMVNVVRDRPRLPSEEELVALKSIPTVARFLGEA
jgi:quercetin dioxygenase-like cupin family protein